MTIHHGEMSQTFLEILCVCVLIAGVTQHLYTKNFIKLNM